MLNIDVLAPIPSPSVITAMRVKPGVRHSDLMAKRRSRKMTSPALTRTLPIQPEDSFMAISSAHPLADIVPGSAAARSLAWALHGSSHLSAPDTRRSQKRDSASGQEMRGVVTWSPDREPCQWGGWRFGDTCMTAILGVKGSISLVHGTRMFDDSTLDFDQL